MPRRKKNLQQQRVPYICNICGQHLASGSAFANHEKAHGGPLIFCTKCNFCTDIVTMYHNHVRSGECPGRPHSYVGYTRADDTFVPKEKQEEEEKEEEEEEENTRAPVAYGTQFGRTETRTSSVAPHLKVKRTPTHARTHSHSHPQVKSRGEGTEKSGASLSSFWAPDFWMARTSAWSWRILSGSSSEMYRSGVRPSVRDEW